MGFVGSVVDIEEEGDVKVDLGGGDDIIADNFGPPGDDSPPLPGDTVALAEGTESGTLQTTGYDDPNNSPVAAPGEKRFYARDSNGVIVGVISLKGDGTFELGDHSQSFVRGEDLMLYIDAIIAATSTAIGGVPIAGAALKAAFDAAILAALPLKLASLSKVFKGE